MLKIIIALVPIVGAGVVWMQGGGACAAIVHYRYTMNQRFSSQALTSIVGATLAVDLVALRGEGRGEASKRRPKILFQNETELKQIAANGASGAGLRL